METYPGSPGCLSNPENAEAVDDPGSLPTFPVKSRLSHSFPGHREHSGGAASSTHGSHKSKGSSGRGSHKNSSHGVSFRDEEDEEGSYVAADYTLTDAVPEYPIMCCPATIHYSYFALWAGCLGLLLTAPGQAVGFTNFTEMFVTELDMSRSTLALEYSMSTFFGGLGLMFLGGLIDVVGVRRSSVVGVVGMGIMSLCAAAVWSATGLEVVFLLQRVVSNSFLTVCCTKMISTWWIKRRGLAIGIASATTCLGNAFLYNKSVKYFMGVTDWRSTLLIIGVAQFLLLFPVIFLFFAEEPTKYNLEPDGVYPAPEELDEAIPEEEDVPDPDDEAWEVGYNNNKGWYEWSPREAFHTTVFWTLSLGLAWMSYCTTGIFLNIEKLFADQNIVGDSEMQLFFFVVCLCSAATSLVCGVIIDYAEPRYSLAAGLVVMGAAVETSVWLKSMPSAHVAVLVFGLLFGFGAGTLLTVLMAAYGEYFGSAHLGAINGSATAILLMGSSAGPVTFGTYRDQVGNFNLILHGAAMVCFVIAVVNLAAQKPKEPVEDEETYLDNYVELDPSIYEENEEETDEVA